MEKVEINGGINMKNRILVSMLILSSNLLGEDNKLPPYEWIDAKNLFITADGVYIDTNKGMTRLLVIDYDAQTNRYLVGDEPINQSPSK